MREQSDVTAAGSAAPLEGMESTDPIVELRRLRRVVALQAAEIGRLERLVRYRAATSGRVAVLQEAAVVARTAPGGDGGATVWGRGHRSGCKDAAAAILDRIRTIESEEDGGSV